MGWQSSVNSRAQGVRSDAELKLLQQVTLHSSFLLGVVNRRSAERPAGSSSFECEYMESRKPELLQVTQSFY